MLGQQNTFFQFPALQIIPETLQTDAIGNFENSENIFKDLCSSKEFWSFNTLKVFKADF